jgi:hypothetical protein
MALDPITAILNIGTTLLTKLVPDPLARAELQLKLAALQAKGELDEITASLAAINAEATSTDAWTSRARPAFLYVVYAFLLASLPMGVLSAFDPALAGEIAKGFQAWLAAIPRPIIDLFAVGYLGYTGARSFDKWKGTK